MGHYRLLIVLSDTLARKGTSRDVEIEKYGELFSMMNRMRDMARHDAVLRKLFRGDMEILLAIRKSSPRNRQREKMPRV